MTAAPNLDTDAVIACADLTDRAGAIDLEIGYLHDDAPAEKAAWYATARYLGVKITVENHTGPDAAATALAQRLLENGTCRCGRRATLTATTTGCRWQLQGQRWEPGCDAPSIATTSRGNLAQLSEAMPQQVLGNRADRRRAAKGRPR